MAQETPPDIPYDKNLELVPGRVDEPMPGVRRVLCNNPSPFTFKGTVSYIVGRGNVAVIDPGPEDPIHSAALLEAVRGETVTHIFVTHTHRDHSPGVPAIKAATGALVLGEGPHRAARALHVGDGPRLESSNDVDFKPDRALADGEVVRGDGWTLEAVATPGHTANHMAFAFKENNVLFSGDHVMAWSTPVVAPPDGSMGDYMASLQKLSKRAEPVYFPGHGSRREQCAALRRRLHPASQGARGLDPQPPAKRRERYPDDGQRNLRQPRPAPHQGGRHVGAGASGGPGGARRGRDQWPAVDRRALSPGLSAHTS
jgi:glyoxylase-like metal-dependent hydrolase (beta-lactamase superfamily II)